MFLRGTHLDDIHKTHLAEIDQQEQSMEKITEDRTPGEYLKKNERCRYHYLEFPENVPIVPSVIDFKHYFFC